MTSITTSLDIAAPASRVWRTVVDWRAYPAWNPFIRAVKGELRVGARISVSVATPVGPLSLGAVVTRLVPGVRLAWHSGLGAAGLFDRDHVIEVLALPDGSRVIQTQTFSGLLAPAASIVAGATVRSGLARMNAALKARVES